MARNDIDRHFSKVENLIIEIDELVPSASYSAKSIRFRADLAGLLVVAMAATYEICVKEVLCEYASKQHTAFGNYAVRQYEKLNSRVGVGDLRKYCETFDPLICTRFRARLTARKKRLLDRVGKNIETSYEQILSWRHEFAHAAIPQTTVEEAAATHRIGKRIIYIFDDAFNRP